MSGTAEYLTRGLPENASSYAILWHRLEDEYGYQARLSTNLHVKLTQLKPPLTDDLHGAWLALLEFERILYSLCRLGEDIENPTITYHVSQAMLVWLYKVAV